ncbi:MAG: methyltransferase domain-containing protein [Candidatus Hermodarchaeota archaeon]
MRKLFYFDNNSRCTIWNGMWSSRTIEQELEACKIETAPRVLFLNYLPKNGKIIDAGCGFGKWVIFLSERGYEVIGVDNNNLAITKLKQFRSSLKVDFGNILKLNYPDNFFDAYISMGVIEHFEDGPLLALKEAYRVLKPNGLIFVSTPTVNIIRKIFIQPILNVINRFYYTFTKFYNFLNKNNLIDRKFKKDKREKKERKNYYHFIEYRFTSEELQAFLKKSNFEVIKVVPHDFHDSKNHAIGLGVDFPFLKARNSVNFELNSIGKIISRILDWISPWIACASILCVGKSLKKAP